MKLSLAIFLNYSYILAILSLNILIDFILIKKCVLSREMCYSVGVKNFCGNKKYKYLQPLLSGSHDCKGPLDFTCF